jgi:hypothetical protein
MYDKKHYQNNKEYYKLRNSKARVRIRNWLNNKKDELKCVKCNEDHPACLEFHHLDPNEKEIGISLAVSNCWSIARIEKEMKKCIVLCSNCHRKLHYAGLAQ